MPTGWRYKTEESPQCPHCGCRDAQVMAQPVPDGVLATGVARCLNCGTVFNFRGPPEDDASADEDDQAPPAYRVVRDRLRCPACQSTEFRTYHTEPATHDGSVTRYHACRKCQNRFSSLER